MTDWASRDAFHELLDVIRDADRVFVEGDRELTDEVSVAEGYRFLTDALHAALEIYLRSDAQRPAFVPIVGPTFKWGGDNSDSFYNFAPISPAVEYLVRGKRGDAVYISVCVYGGPDDGRWSTRIVSNISDRDIVFDDDGRFEIAVARERPPGARNWLPLADDANTMITATTTSTRCTARPPSTRSKRFPAPRHLPRSPTRRSRAASAPSSTSSASCSSSRRCLRANRTSSATCGECPTRRTDGPRIDAHYAMGSFELADDEQLVIEGRSPESAYWGCMLWNPFMQTFDYRYQRIGINSEQATYEPDGSWRLHVAAHDPGHPNWLSTAGHTRGVLFFRWFLAAETPPTPTAHVEKR